MKAAQNNSTETEDFKLSEQNSEKIRLLIEFFENVQKELSDKLHDTIGPLLASAKMKIEMINLKTEQTDPMFNDILNKIKDAGIEVRNLIQDLHPVEIDNYGLRAAINVYIGKLKENSQLKIHLVCPDKIYVDKKWELLLFRIISGSLKISASNHECSDIDLLIVQNKDYLKIIQIDDGTWKDSNAEQKWFIIRLMTESMQGEINIDFKQDDGARIEMIIPGKK